MHHDGFLSVIVVGRYPRRRESFDKKHREKRRPIAYRGQRGSTWHFVCVMRPLARLARQVFLNQINAGPPLGRLHPPENVSCKMSYRNVLFVLGAAAIALNVSATDADAGHHRFRSRGHHRCHRPTMNACTTTSSHVLNNTYAPVVGYQATGATGCCGESQSGGAGYGNYPGEFHGGTSQGSVINNGGRYYQGNMDGYQHNLHGEGHIGLQGTQVGGQSPVYGNGGATAATTGTLQSQVGTRGGVSSNGSVHVGTNGSVGNTSVNGQSNVDVKPNVDGNRVQADADVNVDSSLRGNSAETNNGINSSLDAGANGNGGPSGGDLDVNASGALTVPGAGL